MVLKNFQLENKTFLSGKYDKKSYSLHKMDLLVCYSFARGFTKASVIYDMAKNHTYFQYVANAIDPDEDTVIDFMVPFTVQFAILGGLTNIENISVDSTYAKSANNKFNVIHKLFIE